MSISQTPTKRPKIIQNYGLAFR